MKDTNGPFLVVMAVPPECLRCSSFTRGMEILEAWNRLRGVRISLVAFSAIRTNLRRIVKGGWKRWRRAELKSSRLMHFVDCKEAQKIKNKGIK